MKPLWPRLVATHLNTVLATASWELIEPERASSISPSWTA